MPKQQNPWKKLSSKIAYENPWIRIREDKVIKPDGSNGIYGVVQIKSSAVFIVAFDSKNRICLVEQFRYTTNQVSIEVPAGHSEGQRPMVAAKREFWEETGFKAKEWKQVGQYFSVNGISDHSAYVFVARGLYQTNQNKKVEDGISSVKFYSLNQVLKMVEAGVIKDGQAIASLFRALLYLKFVKSK